MDLNFPIVFAAALIPLLVGFVYYHPKVFGNAWMKAAGVSADGPKPNMILVFGLTYLFSVMLGVALISIVIHQMGIFSTLQGNADLADPNSQLSLMLKDFMAKYGHNFRTFKHGALHGTIAAVFFALPVFGINSLFERKGWKYFLINLGYWVIALALMGGVICQFA